MISQLLTPQELVEVEKAVDDIRWTLNMMAVVCEHVSGWMEARWINSLQRERGL